MQNVVPEFQRGSLVQLRSGGPVMTVAFFHTDHQLITCRWFDSEGLLQEATQLKLITLKLVAGPGSYPHQVQEGDLVKLKSGGPTIMTVESIHQNEAHHLEAECVWFADDKAITKETIEVDALAVFEYSTSTETLMN